MLNFHLDQSFFIYKVKNDATLIVLSIASFLFQKLGYNLVYFNNKILIYNLFMLITLNTYA